MVKQDLKKNMVGVGCVVVTSVEAWKLLEDELLAMGEPRVQFQRDRTVLANYVLLKPRCFSKVPSRKEEHVC